MKFRLNLRRVQALVLLACFAAFGCNKDVKPRKLEGEWRLDKINGQSAGSDGFTWEFEDDGDFQWCFDGGDCYFGEWEWNNDKDEIDLEWTDSFGDRYFAEFEVEMLDKEVLEGDFISDGYNYDLEFERD